MTKLRRGAQMMEAFNVYRSTTLLEYVDRPHTFAFVDGVAIKSLAKVMSADPYGLVLKVVRDQTQALERASTVLLESPLHGATYRAIVDLVDHRTGYLSLSGLEPFGSYHERRAHGRAVPAIPMLAQVSGHGSRSSGRVVDVSTHSLAANFDSASFLRVAAAPLVRLDVWGEPDVEGPLPDFEVTARVSRSEGEEPPAGGVCRGVLEFDPYPALGTALRRYVARRERDILTELNLAGALA